ncbi:MAG: hypothetical protein JWN44_5845 [Myxococcales bacterium]|nr:hypothetical protein [Myxococcales bacterium]
MANPIVVTGATGTLGRPLVATLRARGLAVRALSRRGEVRADLTTGEGLEDAVRGAAVIIHAASDPQHPEHDVAATRRLIEVAQRHGVGHFIYISIVGIEKFSGMAYYRVKLDCEALVRGSTLPWTILRATQFFELLPERMFPVLGRFGPLVVGRGWQIQPVEVREVADKLADIAAGPPAGMLPDFAGPELLTWEQMARDWKRAGGTRKPVWALPLPGAVSRAMRAGALTAPAHTDGKLRWSQWLHERFAGAAP